MPFKREAPTQAAPEANPQNEPPLEPSTEASVYPDGVQRIRINDTLIERSPGMIRASLARDFDADGRGDVMVITTDADGHAQLEAVPHGASAPSATLALKAYSQTQACRAVAADLAALGDELAVAAVDFLCDASDAPAAPPPSAAGVTADAARIAPTPSGDSPAVAEPSVPLDLTPPEPSVANAQTHHFIVSLERSPRALLHLAMETADGPDALELVITGSDVDSDNHIDVHAQLQLHNPGAEPLPIGLNWFNRPSGLARDRSEPEQSIAQSAKQALLQSEKQPQLAAAEATRALNLHQSLCREAGAAKLWVDDARGFSCGASSAAGIAAAARTIALARSQSLLPALSARSLLDDPNYPIDTKTRERVTRAIAGIRGDTEYRWQPGPALAAPSSPNVRLPALGFIDDNQLLLRGPIAQTYELATQTLTATGIPGNVLGTDPNRQLAVTEIVRACDGYHLQLIPAAQIVGGIVTGAVIGEPLLAAVPRGTLGTCSPSSFRKGDRGGYTLLGWPAAGALFARGSELQLVPLDAQGHSAGPARTLGPSEPAPSLPAPGALDKTTRYFSVATSEGIAIVDCANPTNTRLVRTPASCLGGRVSDAVLSPSGRKLAMLCAGRVYVAEPAAPSGSTASQPLGQP